MYEQQLAALEKAHRFRERKDYSRLKDFASNDYLGLAENRAVFEKAVERVRKTGLHGAKASMLVNGYHPLHKKLEKALCKQNGFEAGIILGSGFLANLALFETLPRQGDLVLVDADYHASGVLGTKVCRGEVLFFRHNDAEHLKELLAAHQGNRTFIAVEGVYSMGGDLMDPEIFHIAQEAGAVLIVDEAHSAGVVGPNLSGVFDLFGVKPGPLHVKMGTMGKALGSYGAYILAPEETIAFLVNRGKPVIYSTALSLMDTALALEGQRWIVRNRKKLARRVEKAQRTAEELLGIRTGSLVLPVPVKDAQTALELRKKMEKKGYAIGAIRPPTVERPILRIILRLNDLKNLSAMLRHMRKLLDLHR